VIAAVRKSAIAAVKRKIAVATKAELIVDS
jgi:hypothetical protein